MRPLRLVSDHTLRTLTEKRLHVILTLMLSLAGRTVVAAEPVKQHTGSAAASNLAQLPLAFEANEGQQAQPIRFLARGPFYNLYFAPQSVTLALRNHSAQPNASMSSKSQNRTIQIGLSGANAATQITGLDELPERTNYFIGNDPARWRAGVHTYGKVMYKNAYPGTDLVFYGVSGKIEYDFVVRAGANPDEICLAIQGAKNVKADSDGTLAIETQKGTVRFGKPVIYQEEARRRNFVDGHFVVHSGRGPSTEQFLISFQVGDYDHTNSLVIDPVLDYSTYLGGSGGDYSGAIALDVSGNAYVVGSTTSEDFPVTGSAKQAKCAGSICGDVFVAKLNAAGTGLVYATYLGGTQDDFGIAIAVDSAGNAYITGATQSTDYPTTSGALQTTCGGTCFNRDAFVTKLNATGSALLYSTYLGGSGEDWGSGIRVRNGHAFVSGFSGSSDFPTTAGAYRTQMQGQGSSFVVQLNSTGTALNFGTFLGEVDLQDAGPSISLDSAGNSYLVGDTLSSNYPVTSGAFRTSFQSDLQSNLYVTKLNSSGTGVVFSALIGGAGITSGSSVDGSGNVYFAAAAGTFFPVTPNAVEQSCASGVLIGKLSADGSRLLASAHLCPDRAWPQAAGFDHSGSLIAGGYTDSTVLPTTVGAFQKSIRNVCCFSDGFLMRLAPDASALTYSTYLGGNSSDSVSGLTTDSAGNFYLTGYTSSSNFPINNAFQAANAGGADAFISKVTLPATKLSISPARLSFSAQGLGILSLPIDVDLANVSSASILISAVSASGDFIASSNCGTEILAGGRCSIAVSFKPTAVGKRTGSLQITDGLGSQGVALSGTGINGPVVKFSSIYQIFNQPAGTTSPPLPITVTNIGNSNLVISQISLTNGPEFNFAGTTNCLIPITPLGSCTVSVNFTPFSQFGEDVATLTLSDNTKNGSDAFGLIGYSAGPGIVFSRSGVRFNQEQIGTRSASQRVALINGSSSSITISGIKASANFVQAHTCGTTLGAGKFCYIDVSFKPGVIGILQGSVTVTDSGVGSPHVLSLIGTGR